MTTDTASNSNNTVMAAENAKSVYLANFLKSRRHEFPGRQPLRLQCRAACLCPVSRNVDGVGGGNQLRQTGHWSGWGGCRLSG